MLALLRRLQAMEGAPQFALHGSFPLLAWGGEPSRTPADMDLVLMPSCSSVHGRETIHRAIADSVDGYDFEITSEGNLRDYTGEPGVRYFLKWESDWLQLDIVEEECLPLDPIPMTLVFPELQQQVTALCCPPELHLARKLRWMLVEWPWEMLDLHDVLLLLRLDDKLDAAKVRISLSGLFRQHNMEAAELYRYLDHSLYCTAWRNAWHLIPPHLRTLVLPSQEATLAHLADRIVALCDGQLGLPGDAEWPLLRLVLTTPEDANARLVYADWLEEQDDPRAELVRLDLELSTIVASRLEQHARHAALLAQANTAHPGWAARVCRWAAPQA